jgi:hypothetical protein
MSAEFYPAWFVSFTFPPAEPPFGSAQRADGPRKWTPLAVVKPIGLDWVSSTGKTRLVLLAALLADVAGEDVESELVTTFALAHPGQDRFSLAELRAGLAAGVQDRLL